MLLHLMTPGASDGVDATRIRHHLKTECNEWPREWRKNVALVSRRDQKTISADPRDVTWIRSGLLERRRIGIDDSPVSVFIPVVAEQLDRVLGAIGTIATS